MCVCVYIYTHIYISDIYTYIYQIESRKSEMELMQALISSHWVEWVRFTYVHVDTIKLPKTNESLSHITNIWQIKKCNRLVQSVQSLSRV